MKTEWNKDKIVELLAKNDKAVIRALLRIYENQTTDEQRERTVKYHNGIGFTAAHASIATSMVTFYKSNGFLTPRQIRYWRVTNAKGRMRIAMYANQLLREIQG